ncbi:MAG: ABC transporter substrate-binding protein [Dehalococcoidia bacterium]
MARVYDRFLKQRLSRRRMLAATGGTALGAAGIALVGCGDDGGNGNGPDGNLTPAADETPTTEGILRQSQTSPYPSLSPFGPTSLASSGIFGFTAYDHFWYTPIDTGEPELMLAENIEMVDPEGLETIITMKEAFYHDKPPVDGRQVLSSDVNPSWERFRDDPFGLGREWMRNVWSGMETPDDLTVIIRQSEPFAFMFGTAAAGSAFSSSILPVETLDEDLFDLSRDVIGSGRFLLDSHNNGENLKFRRHPNWRIPGEPFLAGIDYVLITEAAAARAQFRAGNLDSVGLPNKIEADQMKSDLGDDIIITSDLSRSYNVLMLKMTPPFDDERVRRAIHLAVDRDELIALVEIDAAGGVPSGIVQPALERDALSQDEYAEEYFRSDSQEARAMLEDAGFPFDQTYTLKYPSPGDATADRALVLQEQLGRAGVNVRLEPQDLLTVWLPNTLNQGDFDMTLFTHLPYEDAYLPLAFYSDSSPIGPLDDARGRNNMGFFDDEYIAAFHDIVRTLDTEERTQKIHDAQRMLINKWPPMINLYSSVSFGARWHWYKGIVSGRGSFGLFNGRAWIDTALRGS